MTPSFREAALPVIPDAPAGREPESIAAQYLRTRTNGGSLKNLVSQKRGVYGPGAGFVSSSGCFSAGTLAGDVSRRVTPRALPDRG